MHTPPYTGQIGKADTISLDQKLSFQNSYRAYLLPVGFELWRFASRSSRKHFGSYWIDPQTMEDVMQIFHDNNNFSDRYKKDRIKNSLAILDNWSNVSWRVKIKLSKEVIAYVGQIGKQKKWIDVDNTMPFGRGEMEQLIEIKTADSVQYVIPRFEKLPDLNEWAKVQVVVHI